MRVFKMFFLFVALFCVSQMDAQTFKFVEARIVNGANDSETAAWRTRVLGSKMTVNFYGNNAKVTFNYNDMDPFDVVYTKDANGNYVFKNSDFNITEVMKFNTFVKYLRGGTIEAYIKEGQKSKLIIKMTFERI